MNTTQKKMAVIFKDFFEKTCLSVIKQHIHILKQWLYFSSMISQEIIDFPRIERYIQNLTTKEHSEFMSNTSKSFTLPTVYEDPLKTTLRKIKSQNKDNKLNFTPAYSSSVALSDSIYNIKQYTNSQVYCSESQILRKNNLKYDATKTMISKLNCLYMTFIDNQHKLEFPKKESGLPRSFSDIHQMVYK